MRCLSSLLEKLEEEKQSTDTDVLSHDTLTQMMQPIKAEMESCKSCWEEGMNRIDKLQKGKLASKLCFHYSKVFKNKLRNI